MKIIYKFSPTEKCLISLLGKMRNTFTFSSQYDEFREKYKNEIVEFINAGLLYHSNLDDEGSYIRYSVSSKGLYVFDNLK